MSATLLTGLTRDLFCELIMCIYKSFCHTRHGHETCMYMYLFWMQETPGPWLICSPGPHRCLASPHLGMWPVMTQQTSQGQPASGRALLQG